MKPSDKVRNQALIFSYSILPAVCFLKSPSAQSPGLSYASNRLLNKLPFFLSPATSHIKLECGIVRPNGNKCLHSWHNF